MAALMRIRHAASTATLLTSPNALYATKAEKKKGIDKKVAPRIDSAAESLAAKGFLRPQKEYAPPSDVKSKLEFIFKNLLGTAEESTPINDLRQKYDLCVECTKVFDHRIPNSLLHTMKTLGDVQRFYATPVETITPLDRLKHMDLPPNLHVQHEYHRFRPDADTKFGGVTAFPERSTIVTGLKYKGKYKGHVQKIKHPEL